MRLRKTLKSSTRRWLAPLFIAGVTGALLASCAAPPSRGDNVAQINEAPLPNPDTSLLQGYVSQTRVEGATVWIDRADANGNYNNVLDFGETSGTTSNNGLFSLTQSPLDESNNYVINSVGGSAQSVGTAAESVGVMLAPRGARNITPLTTVVALNNELAAKIGQTLLSSSSQSYSEAYDVDIAKSGGTYGEHLQLAKGIETFMYVLGRTNPDLPIISSTQGHVDALQILAENLNELDSKSLFNATNIATKIGEAAAEVLDPTQGDPIEGLLVLSTADQAAIVADLQSAATAVMAEVTTGTGRKITESSVLSACSNAFAASDLVANKTLSTKASSLSPYASSITIADETGSLIYDSTSADFTMDDDQDPDNITVTFTTTLDKGESLTVDYVVFSVELGAPSNELYVADNVTFSKNSTGDDSIVINGISGSTKSCDITTDGNSFILNYDNVTIDDVELAAIGAPPGTIACNSTSLGPVTANSLVEGTSPSTGGATTSGKIKIFISDANIGGLTKSFRLNLKD